MNKLSPVDQLYHLEPHTGLLNDPVGLVWHDNQYHVFFQWNSRFKDHSQKEWGHFTSGNLLDWKQHPSPLIPSRWYDRNGVYSGSCCVFDSKLLAFYTGNRKENGIRSVHQCLAVSYDGLHFHKEGPVLPVLPGYTTHFRDPRVIEDNGKLYMLIGAQNEKMQGCILLLESHDGYSWTFLQEIGKSRTFEMIECPEIVRFAEGHVLIYGLQKRDMQSDTCLDSFSVYQVLDTDFKNVHDLDLDWNFIRLEEGFDGYAHQALYDPSHQRYLLMAWMNRLSEVQEQQLAAVADHIHCLSLPRVLDLKNGRLIQKPAEELDQHFTAQPLKIDNVWNSEARAWKLEVQIDSDCDQFSLVFQKGECGITWNPDLKILQFIRQFGTSQAEEIRTIELNCLESLSIYMDTSSIEVFVNDGAHVLSARLLPAMSGSSIELQSADFSRHPELLLYPYEGRWHITRLTPHMPHAKKHVHSRTMPVYGTSGTRAAVSGRSHSNLSAARKSRMQPAFKQ